MPQKNDVGPMLPNVLLIIIGVPFAVWLLANPQKITDAQAWMDSHDMLWKLGAFVAIQPLMFIFWKWLVHRKESRGRD